MDSALCEAAVSRCPPGKWPLPLPVLRPPGDSHSLHRLSMAKQASPGALAHSQVLRGAWPLGWGPRGTLSALHLLSGMPVEKGLQGAPYGPLPHPSSSRALLWPQGPSGQGLSLSSLLLRLCRTGALADPRGPLWAPA